MLRAYIISTQRSVDPCRDRTSHRSIARTYRQRTAITSDPSAASQCSTSTWNCSRAQEEFFFFLFFLFFFLIFFFFLFFLFFLFVAQICGLRSSGRAAGIEALIRTLTNGAANPGCGIRKGIAKGCLPSNDARRAATSYRIIWTGMCFVDRTRPSNERKP